MSVTADLDAAVGAVKSGDLTALGARDVHGWTAFTAAEEQRVKAVRRLVDEVKWSAPAKPDKGVRPVSVAVFGPPGCGKSTAVEKILGGKKAHTFNLTQIRGPWALADALLKKIKDAKDVSYVFFDEFDAPLEGARWGWLPWLLAPMEDGVVYDANGTPNPLGSAVFFFAGGTAESLTAFSGAADPAAFRAAKGPDFVSRLSDFYDIAGPNVADGRERLARRAGVLHRICKPRSAAGGVHDDLLRAMLQAGRYRHGARSMNTVGSFVIAGAGAVEATREHLPDPAALGVHVDRGPMDPTVRGGCIALSGGGTPNQQENFEPAWRAVAHRLWQDGATIAFGGIWDTGGLSDVLRTAASELPRALTREPNLEPPRVRSFPPGRQPQPGDGVVDEHGVLIERHVQGVLPGEGDGWSGWLHRAVSLFRMRLQVADVSVARVAMGGKTVGYSGRFAGLAEEVMLSLRAGHPIFVAGGYGGAARDVGALLGLARPWYGSDMPTFRVPYGEENERELQQRQELFRPPPWADLPVTVAELVCFLKEHALGGPKWPDNGLTVSENRALFESVDAAEVARFVEAGLRRRFEPQG